jgi:cytochrome b561
MTYGTTARLLHWIMAVLVIGMIVAGNVMTMEIERPLQDRLFIFHKSTGAVLILLIALRIVWRLSHPAPPLPASVPPLQKVAAHVTHVGLYLFLVVMVVSGYVRVTAGGFPIDILDWLGIPPLFAKDEALAATAKSVHAAAKYGLGLLVIMHVGAAAYHGLVLRDGVFTRMWPPVRPAREAGRG